MIKNHAIASRQKLVIKAGRTEQQYWQDIWKYRELFYFLAWRDILVRYKQTTIGLAWALLRPFLTTMVFTLVFGVLLKAPLTGAPYPIAVLCDAARCGLGKDLSGCRVSWCLAFGCRAIALPAVRVGLDLDHLK